MKRVLLVTALFPPQLGGTAEKMGRRAKYFARNGWQAVVLAPQIPPETKTDATLLEQVGEAEIHRTPYLFQSRWPSLRHDKNRPSTNRSTGLGRLLDLAFVPKGYVRWFPHALKEGLRLARSVDAILTMNNPVTLHLIGYILHLLTGKPWVVELRDPIVEYSYGMRGPERLNYFLESLVVKKAAAVIQRLDFVPDPIRPRYPHLPESKFHVIPYTGYDPDDFSAPAADAAQTGPNGCLTIAYTGSFYGDTITPLPFLGGLKRLVQATGTPASELQVLFAGDWNPQYQQRIAELELQAFVHFVGYLPYTECVRLWRESQALLLILGNEEENVRRVPSKFWDYLGVRRPMLALVAPQGEVARLVREQRLGFVAEPESEEEIAEALKALIDAHRAGSLQVHPAEAFYQQASRAMSEKQVVDVLEEVIRDA